MKMARFTLKLTLLVFFVFIFLTEGKKQTESKSEKRQKGNFTSVGRNVRYKICLLEICIFHF